MLERAQRAPRTGQTGTNDEQQDAAADRPLAARVHAELAAGGFQSGAALARQLGVSRNAIWKAVRTLRGLGLTIHAVRHRGYRLPVPCDPLDPAAIRAALTTDAQRHIRRIDAMWSIDSTNAALLARAAPPPGLADILLAEHQTAGRGRLGRGWLALPGGSICLSIGWSFPQLPRDLGALGLAVGVAALRALRAAVGGESRFETRLGPTPARLALKWPNDLVLGDRKLGGILIEMRAESAGPTYVVIGIGVNLFLGARLAQQVAATGTQVADLASTGADTRRRNALVARLASEIISGLVEFQREGLRPFAGEWKAADMLCGRPVIVRSAQAKWQGIARGIDASGALLVQTPQGVRQVTSGDVSVRAADGAAMDGDGAAMGGPGRGQCEP